MVIAACFCFSSPSLAFGPSNDIILNGIDISDWQGDIDFNAVKESGIDIVYIKAGQGGYEDQLLESNYNKAKAAGLNIGFYYYLTATNTEQAKAQANNFAEILQGKDTDSLPAMDFESFGSLSQQEINEIAITFMETLAQATGKTPIIYSWLLYTSSCSTAPISNLDMMPNLRSISMTAIRPSITLTISISNTISSFLKVASMPL